MRWRCTLNSLASWDLSKVKWQMIWNALILGLQMVVAMCFLCKQTKANEHRTNVVLVGFIHLALYSFIFEQT